MTIKMPETETQTPTLPETEPQTPARPETDFVPMSPEEDMRTPIRVIPAPDADEPGAQTTRDGGTQAPPYGGTGSQTPPPHGDPVTRRPQRPGRWWWLVWMLVVAALGADFSMRALQDQTKTRYPYHWTARWIQSSAEGSTVCFRKTITISGRIRNAYLIVAADNSYNLQVNGGTVVGRFRTLNSYSLDRLHSTYNMIGYSRRWGTAHVFDLQPVLSPGRNVISITTQSDTEQPAILVEGQVIAADTIPIVSDSSWKCSAGSEETWDTNWASPGPIDTQWPQAVYGPSRGTPFVDGYIAALDTPTKGSFIMAPGRADDGQVTYKRSFYWRGGDGSGWVRLITRVPFDLSLNGEPLVTTAHVTRNWMGNPTRRNAVDVLPRLLLGGQPARYPSIGRRFRANTVFFVNTIHPGWNTLTITTHDTEGLVDRGTPSMIQVDGELTAQTAGDQSSAQPPLEIRSGPDWEAWNGPNLIGNCIDVATPRGIDTFDNSVYMSRPSTRVGQTNFLRHRATLTLIWIGVCSLLMAGLTVIGLMLPGRPVTAVRNSIIAPAFILIGAALLQTAFEQSIESIQLDSTATCAIVLNLTWIAWAIAVVMAIATALRVASEGRTADAQHPGRLFALLSAAPGDQANFERSSRWWAPLSLGVILAVSACLYFRSLDHYGFLPDEYVSMLAARGIARHGIPIYDNTGVIYTRSSLFLYLLAPLVGASGDPNATLVRGLAALWQLATIILVFVFARSVRGPAAAVAAAAFVAFSPMMAFYAREVRFYTEETFFLTLSLYFLWRSMQEPQDARYRLAVWAAYCGSYLSQQLSLAVLPSYFLVMLFTKRTREWLTGWTLAAMIFSFVVMIADFVAYLHFCQTPLPFVDADSVQLIGLHPDVLESVPNMLLIGDERSHLIVGLLYVLGLAGAIFMRRDRTERPAGSPMVMPTATFLYVVSIPVIAVTTLITPRPAERYAVHAYPIIAIAAAYTLSAMVVRARRYLHGSAGTRPGRFDHATLGGILLAALALICYRPIRMWNNTQRAIVAGVTPATRYVRTASQPGDKVIFFSPEAAMLDLGRCDYFWHETSDSIYLYIAKDGTWRERNSGAICVDTTDKLINIMQNNKRVWFVIPQWQTIPGNGNHGDFANFLNENFALMDQVHGIQVWLWDKNRNHYNLTVPQYQSEGPGYSEVQ
jgi:hypothetical protein